MCIIVPNFVEISQPTAVISQFFEMAAVYSNCLTDDANGEPILSNFVEIGQTVAEIWQFIEFFNMAVLHHLGFVEPIFGLARKSTAGRLYSKIV